MSVPARRNRTNMGSDGLTGFCRLGPVGVPLNRLETLDFEGSGPALNRTLIWTGTEPDFS